MKWLKDLFSSKQATDREESAKNINDIPLVELERLYKIAAISILEKSNIEIKISKYNRELDKNFIFKMGLFSIEPTYGASSTDYICNDITNLLNKDIGHNTVFDLRGNKIGNGKFELSCSIAASILSDKNVDDKVKNRLRLLLFKDYIDDAKFFQRDNHVDYGLFNMASYPIFDSEIEMKKLLVLLSNKAFKDK